MPRADKAIIAERTVGEGHSMTIVVGVSTGAEVCLVADCRLSRPGVKRDICQKLFVANSWSIVGFSGQLCMARHLLRGIGARLRATPRATPDWLRDDEAILRLVRQGVRSHVRLKADHRPCQKEPVAILIAWVDHLRSFLGDERRPDDAESFPMIQLIAIRSPQMTIHRTAMGLDIVGTGAEITKPMRDKAYLDISWYARDLPFGHVQRSFFTAIVVRKLLDEVGVPTVGGLYQLAILGPGGVQVVPYFNWAPVEPGYGTYVAMRIENGGWVQEHRPTATKIHVLSPFDIHWGEPSWCKSEVFEPGQTLTRHSPGVIPTPTPWLIEFDVYDPDNVHEQVRASWGSEPMRPLSWGSPWSEEL